MTCLICGSTETGRFCAQCGAPLGTESLITTPATTPAAQPQVAASAKNAWNVLKRQAIARPRAASAIVSLVAFIALVLTRSGFNS